jgi:hypothetical protein
LEISLDRGDIELRPGNVPLPKMDVRTGSGDIEFAVPEKAKFDLNATTNRGEITNDFGGNFHAENEGRGAQLRGNAGEGPRVALSTNRGAITLRKASTSERTGVFPDVPTAEPKPGKHPAAPKPPEAPPALKPLEQ